MSDPGIFCPLTDFMFLVVSVHPFISNRVIFRPSCGVWNTISILIGCNNLDGILWICDEHHDSLEFYAMLKYRNPNFNNMNNIHG